MIKFFLHNRLVTVLLILALVVWGIITAPFGWKIGGLPSDPVAIDAIPDIGENQQIVFTEWPGHAPQDIEDQVSYPLTTYLLGLPGVKSVRSSSVFGFSSIYVIFKEDVEFYWSRSRILEKLNALPAGLLPAGVSPTLGPDATALGQVFWYTIEGRDQNNQPTGGWSLQDIRSAQDFLVKYGLNAVEGVAEVASIGGYVKEYQVDVDPDALNAYHLSLSQVMKAVQQSNKDVGAKTVEINQAEYLIRGLGLIKSTQDIEEAVVAVQSNVPVRVKDVAHVKLGPANRRGLLDKDGAEAVGGVVVARYGANPLQVINKLKEKIKQMAPGMPQKTLKDGRVSKLTIVPFYDRSTLIHETLGTLREALSMEVLISILVVIVMVINLRASLLISSLLPIAVLSVFIVMRYAGVDANIVALSGIAIAIGTMVDLGIVMSENIIKHLDEAPPEQKLIDTIYIGAKEVGSAIITAVATTIVSFVPVFTMQASEGKLFRPLAFTKSFALLSALVVSLLILPTLAYWFFGWKVRSERMKLLLGIGGMITGLVLLTLHQWFGGWMLFFFGLIPLYQKFIAPKVPQNKWTQWTNHLEAIISIVGVVWLLAKYWMPLGANESLWRNFIFVALIVGLILFLFYLLEVNYKRMLLWCLNNKIKFLSVPIFVIFFGLLIWQGFNATFSWFAKPMETIGWSVRSTALWKDLSDEFPGTGKEFMPSLNEGSFLLMPTSMPHSGVSYNRKVVGQLDRLLTNIPEVDMTVGKMGRVNSALDPAPISMFENVINYKPEFMTDAYGERLRFKVDEENKFITTDGRHLSNAEGLKAKLKQSDLIENQDGRLYRNWRKEIKSPDDIWKQIAKVSKIPGVTSAPKLQPIETRLVMLQTGMRAPMGIKVFGPDLPTIQDFGIKLEDILKQVPSVKKEAVFADRIVGKPYLLIKPNREQIARYGLSMEAIQKMIATTVGGMQMTTTIEGRERYAVRVRYPRELRDNPEAIGKILISTPTGAQIPLRQLAEIAYERGPQAIKSENTFLLGYVLFDKMPQHSEVEVVNDAQQVIEQAIDTGRLKVPAGVSYQFSGSYENQVRAEQRLAVIMPIVLLIIFLILYFQFKSVGTSLMVFCGISMAFSGGFLMLWLYGQSWFADFSFMGVNMRELFQMHTINLSVAVWVGFIALFGIATDDGVLIATYLDQSFEKYSPENKMEIRQAVVKAGQRRIKPAIMTSATTIIALLPVLTSTGRGSDIMIPMAIPSFGGMLVASITFFIVPVLYCWRAEWQLKKKNDGSMENVG